MLLILPPCRTCCGAAATHRRGQARKRRRLRRSAPPTAVRRRRNEPMPHAHFKVEAAHNLIGLAIRHASCRPPVLPTTRSRCWPCAAPRGAMLAVATPSSTARSAGRQPLWPRGCGRGAGGAFPGRLVPVGIFDRHGLSLRRAAQLARRALFRLADAGPLGRAERLLFDRASGACSPDRRVCLAAGP